MNITCVMTSSFQEALKDLCLTVLLELELLINSSYRERM